MFRKLDIPKYRFHETRFNRTNHHFVLMVSLIFYIDRHDDRFISLRSSSQGWYQKLQSEWWQSSMYVYGANISLCFSYIHISLYFSNVHIYFSNDENAFQIDGLVQERRNSTANAWSYVFLVLTHRNLVCRMLTNFPRPQCLQMSRPSTF